MVEKHTWNRVGCAGFTHLLQINDSLSTESCFPHRFQQKTKQFSLVFPTQN